MMIRKLILSGTLSWALLATAAAKPIRVVIWDEQQPAQKKVYSNFLGNEIGEYLRQQPGVEVKSVRLDDPEQGLSDEILDHCDVLIWWGHVRHPEVKAERVEKVISRLKAGKLSLISLHSAHWSQPFVRAMEERTKEDAAKQLSKADCAKAVFEYIKPPKALVKPTDPPSPHVEIRQDGDHKKVIVTLPGCVFPSVRAEGEPSHVTVLKKHAITRGLPGHFDIPQTEMYSEPFTVPTPDVTLIEEKWDKGETFHSASVWKVGKGKVFYYRPGHEVYPVYKQPENLRIVANAVKWLAR